MWAKADEMLWQEAYGKTKPREQRTYYGVLHNGKPFGIMGETPEQVEKELANYIKTFRKDSKGTKYTRKEFTINIILF